jgi:hypothetical protein
MSILADVRLAEKSASACAVTSWRDRVYLGWTGARMSLNLASSPDGREFTDKQQLAHRSYTHVMSTDSSPAKDIALPPSLVGAGERLYLAWTGSDRAINVLVADRNAYSGPVILTQRTRSWNGMTYSFDGLMV